MIEMTCGNCRNYRDGYCHAHPPTINFGATNEDGEYLSEWPPVAESDWCGEHVIVVPHSPFAVRESDTPPGKA